MTFHVVTTTNAAGWEETGRRMAKSFLDRWTDEATLTVYAEGFDPDVDGIEVRRLPGWLDTFKAEHRAIPVHNGHRRDRYDYRYDAVKFSHKVAALTDFGLGLTDGVMIWLDADTFTHAPVDGLWLDLLFPEPAYVAWLDRQNSHPECGFVMFRCSHPYHVPFMERFRDLYTSGDVFKLAETHDSFVLLHLVTAKVASRHIPAPVSLSGAARRTSHVLINSAIGSRLDHMKGGRKANGRSHKHDLVIPRDEPYWKVSA